MSHKMSWVAAASIAAAYGYVAVQLTFVGSLLHADAHLPPVAYGPRLHSQNGERKMKKLLLATAALLLATASANAGSVVFGFEFDKPRTRYTPLELTERTRAMKYALAADQLD